MKYSLLYGRARKHALPEASSAVALSSASMGIPAVAKRSRAGDHQIMTRSIDLAASLMGLAAHPFHKPPSRITAHCCVRCGREVGRIRYPGSGCSTSTRAQTQQLAGAAKIVATMPFLIYK
jgi:hypothetical protein